MTAALETTDNTRLLIIDDDDSLTNLYGSYFKGIFDCVDIANNTEVALKLLSRKEYSIILLDVYLENENGLSIMPDIIRASPMARIFVMTGQDSIELAVQSMELGACSFIPKSLGPEKIQEVISSKTNQHMQNTYTDQDFMNEHNIIGKSHKMQTVFTQIQQFKNVDSTILITGESGVGKEVVAQAIHNLSKRSTHPFTAINCGAIPENLLESELFGHKRGAFTDAKTDKKGLFEACTNGTLMLDEIGDMPYSLQVKILRVLQEKEVRPVGSTTTIKVNPRIIACTHRNLHEMVDKGLFRQDLYFRLSVLQINIPSLRERTDDIPLLTQRFIDVFNRQFNKSVQYPSAEILSRLHYYAWPGNIRELQNTIERGVVLSKDGSLHMEHMFSDQNVSSKSTPVLHTKEELPLLHKEAKEEFERTYINKLLSEAKGNISRASRLSGKHRIELYRLLEKHHMKREDFLIK